MKPFKTLIKILILSTLTATSYAGEENSIGYTTVEEAHAALDKNPNATLTEYEGWKIYKIKDNGVYTLWSFTPFVDAANPAVIKRVIVSKDNEISISMSALCEAEKEPCDHLIEQFKLINEGIKHRMSSGS